MKLLPIALVVAVAVLAGCVTPPRQVTLTSSFDADAAKALLGPGKNSVKGNAFLRQTGGGVVTCAGSEVSAIPVTAYATERMQALYGDLRNGFSQQNIVFAPNLPEYSLLLKTTTCDSQGFFKFDGVADGDFYLVTTVRWMAGNAPQGGYLMRRVALHDGQTESVVMSR